VIKNLLLLQHLIQALLGPAPEEHRRAGAEDPGDRALPTAFLTRVPASAAVDEAVDQAKRFGQSRASGFVNAVLRKATREPAPPLPPREQPLNMHALPYRTRTTCSSGWRRSWDGEGAALL
jgi:hypothetical protein